LDILFLVNTIKTKLLNSFLNKAYLNKLGLTLKFRKQDEIQLIHIDPEGWIFLTNLMPEDSYSNEFIRILREKLENNKLLDIRTPYFDRYVVLDFENGLQLHVEFMRGGNLILTENGLILESFKMNHSRFKPKTEYQNPEINKVNPLELDTNKAIELLKTSKGNLVASFWKILGIPIDITNEACFLLHLDKNVLPSQLEYSNLRLLLEKTKEIIYEYLHNPKPNIVIDKNGEYESVSNIIFKTFEGLEILLYNDLNKAVEEYYFKFKKYKLIKEELQEKEKIMKKNKELIDNLILAYNQLEYENNKLKSYIDKLISSFNYFDKILEKINEYVRIKDWESANSIIKNEWNKELGSIEEIDLKEKKLRIKYDDIIIDIDITRSASSNIDMLYNKIKENKLKIQRMKDKIKELESVKVEDEKRTITVKEVKKKSWYENYLWFHTSNGFLAVAGRDSSQNEALIKKRTEKTDIVFHADIHGSPFLILKTQGKEVKEEDLLEAAQFVASYSSAWKAGIGSLDVYWVKPEQVSKQAPSGTYLGKGSFMIYGKKNYIRNVPLELAIKVDDGKINILPFYSIKEGNVIKLIPGSTSKDKIINKIINTLKELRKNINEKEFRDILIKNLPKGEFDMRIELLPKNK